MSPPLAIPDRNAVRRSKRALLEAHESIWQRCQAFLDAEVARREQTAPPLDRAVRAAERVLQTIGI